jgi:hypothetical protein
MLQGHAQQTYTGVVQGKSGQQLNRLYLASVHTADNKYHTYTDSTGYYSIQLPDSYNAIICSYPGYRTDTIFLITSNVDIILEDITQLTGVIITGKRDESYISSIQTLKTEVITSEGLKKNACCNLAESFESNPTIDGSSADAVTGQRQIQMLGLSGNYVQMLTDMIPDIRGLNIITGLTALPGPFIQNIYIRKGPGSVANSYEGITGQIDVELIKPYDADKFMLNLYVNTQQRLEANTYFRNQIKKWKALTMLHGSSAKLQMDYNKDSFLDNPVYEVFTGIHRWQHFNKHGKETNIGFNYHYDDTKSFNTLKHIHHLPDSAVFQKYIFSTRYHREEIFAKTCIELFHKENNELGLQLNMVNHEQQSQIGNRLYRATEQTLYLNSNFQIQPKNEKMVWRFGGGLMYSRYVQKIDSLDLSRTDIIPGLFTEWTYDNGEKFSIIAGLRADYYNNNNRVYAAPRIHLRYKLGKEAHLRASAGYGWRVANIIQENLNFLVSSREIKLRGNLQPEYAINYGVNYTQNIDISEKEIQLSVDVYRTQFLNQIVVDVDKSYRELWFYNLSGVSYANSIQAQLQVEPLKNLNLLSAVKWNQVRVTYYDRLLQRPFTPQWRGMFNAAYSMFKKKLKIDATLQWVGAQRIAANINYTAEEYNQFAPSYIRVLAQITYQFRQIEWYIGGENLNAFTQKNPIINAYEPYSPGFDAAMIWGPIMGRIAYTGIRYSFK